MVRSVFEGCSDSCGWIAAVVACLCYGTYGVTVKESTKHVDPDPLVMQTYKTIIFFLSSFLVVFLGEEIHWTPWWGLVSGLLWVPGATFGIVGVMYAGMAVAEGTWSSVIVAVNFFWGILIFQEHVKSLPETLLAFTTLTIGLVGMSTAASSTTDEMGDKQEGRVEITEERDYDEEGDDEEFESGEPRGRQLSSSTPSYEGGGGGGGGGGGDDTQEIDEEMIAMVPRSGRSRIKPSKTTTHRKRRRGGSKDGERPRSVTPPPSAGTASATGGGGGGGVFKRAISTATEESNTITAADNFDDSAIVVDNDTKKELLYANGGNHKHHNSAIYDGKVILGGGSLVFSKLQVGIAAAAMNGLCGGTSLVPMHYAAQQGFRGAGYFFSYAAGSMIVNTVMFLLLFVYRVIQRGGSIREGYKAMPRWHFKQLWWPGLLSGILFSAGMLGSVVTVGFLGQGIGNSFVQCKILISGLWGILYYKEIRGRGRIKWFGSASLAVCGILLLSYEHE